MSIKKATKKYRDITKQRLSTASRLNIYNIFRITETNQNFLNHFRYFEIVDSIKNNNAYWDIYVTEENDWWDNISFKFYETSYYWYLLCELNDIINPYEEIQAGQQVKVLRQAFMYEIFKDMSDIAEL